MEQQAATPALWRWWSDEGANRAAAALATRAPLGALADEISARVKTVHPQLVWELGPGDANSEYSLTISAGGVGSLRALSERVIRAAPASDATWVYFAARRRLGDLDSLTANLGGREIRLADVRVDTQADNERHRLHVGLDHPAFAELPPPTRGHITFLCLDWALGEDDVESWIGTVEYGYGRSSLPYDLAGLRSQVDELKARPFPDRWRVLHGHDAKNRPVVAVAMSRLRWIDHLPYDRHLEVRLAYRGEPDGLASPGETERLDALQGDLEAQLGASAVLVAHESCCGQRTVHFYCDSGDLTASAERIAYAWAAAQTPPAVVETRDDPTWDDVRPFA